MYRSWIRSLSLLPSYDGVPGFSLCSGSFSHEVDKAKDQWFETKYDNQFLYNKANVTKHALSLVVFKQIDKEGTELLDKAGLDAALTELGYDQVDLDRALKQVGREQEGHVIFEDFEEIVIGLEVKYISPTVKWVAKNDLILCLSPTICSRNINRTKQISQEIMHLNSWRILNLGALLLLACNTWPKHKGTIGRRMIYRGWWCLAIKIMMDWLLGKTLYESGKTLDFSRIGS